MSYDLAVYATRRASPETLDGLMVSRAGLRVTGASQTSLTVVRGARERYSFTVDGPYDLDAEDVPEDVIALLLSPRCLYRVMVEGSSSTEVVHAIRFSRRLARELDGVVVDDQTDQIWSRTRSRTVQRPEPEQRVAVLDLRWYCLSGQLTSNPAATFASIAQRTVPEALPRRFGSVDPPQHKWVDSGAEGFARTWAETDIGLLGIDGTMPCDGGHLDEPPGTFGPDPFWGMSLTFHAEPIRAPAWRDALRALFVGLCDNLPAFFACARIKRDHIWTGRSLVIDGASESPLHPVSRDAWIGFPPGPSWWSWLGEPLAAYHELLPAEMTTTTAVGALYQSTPDPLDSFDAAPLSTWLPSDLISTVSPDQPFLNRVELTAAPTTPAPLRNLDSGGRSRAPDHGQNG